MPSGRSTSRASVAPEPDCRPTWRAPCLWPARSNAAAIAFVPKPLRVVELIVQRHDLHRAAHTTTIAAATDADAIHRAPLRTRRRRELVDRLRAGAATGVRSDSMTCEMRSHSSAAPSIGESGTSASDAAVSRISSTSERAAASLREVRVDPRSVGGIEQRRARTRRAGSRVRRHRVVEVRIGHSLTPASMSAARSRNSPARIRLFTVPSGCSRITATSR